MKCKYCSVDEENKVLSPINIDLVKKVRDKNKDRYLTDFNVLMVSSEGSIIAEHHASDGAIDEITETYVNYCPMCGRSFANELIDNMMLRTKKNGESLIPYSKSLNHGTIYSS